MSRDRLLVIDTCLGRGLPARLRARGRSAMSSADIGDVEDPDLLRALADRYGDDRGWVLVTLDDALPAEHRDLIRQTRATVATISPSALEGVSEYSWGTDVVQRQAHAIGRQPPHSIRRYDLDGPQPWRPRPGHMLVRPRAWKPADRG